MKTLQAVLKWIQESEGQIFSIKFRKRSDGELRQMTCRTNVKRLVASPKKAPLDQQAARVTTVWDMSAKGYRSIPHEGIVAIKIKGRWHNVGHN